ncbi:glycine zipper 2TM domain-containing protein [Chitinibacter sp. FCG-7]|uniref:Glycine zipper 2TM domain-containing protein n=1 Tax=Chitinibacter mangrovi TaxID=3153927 RepID=A0AAU7FEB7_9NEIS
MRQLTLTVLGFTLLTGSAWAGHQDWDYGGKNARAQRDTAIIRSVTPQYEQVSRPRQECYSEWVSDNAPNNGAYPVTGTVIGGVAGGILGHQVGKGSGRDVATVAGTLIGAMVGNHLASTNQPPAERVQREVQRCRQVNDYTQQVRDYRVDYEYRSRIYSTTTQRYPGKPGERIPVRVSVELDD